MSTQQPGWYPDPLGHADRRWFDGAGWTATVLDAEGRQGIDQLAAPASTVVQASVPPPPPPASNAASDSWARPAGSSSASWADPGSPATWAGPASDQAWNSSSAALAAVVAPTVGAPQYVAPARPVVSSPMRPVAFGLVGLAVVGFVLSLFVLDWISVGPASASFGDLVPDGASADGFLDQLALWHYQWLGYALVGVGVAVVIAAVSGAVGRARAGHVAAAVVAGVGVLVTTFAIVRYFRGPGADPEFGAWLLPAAFVVLLVAVIVSARRPADR